MLYDTGNNRVLQAESPVMKLIITGCCLIICLMAVHIETAEAQAVRIQQPIVQQFSVGTTLTVPDRGSALLGGIRSGATHSRQSGPFRSGSRYGHSFQSSTSSVGVYIHDFEAMDLLESACDSTSIGREKRAKAGDAYVTNYPNPFGSSTTIKYHSEGGLVNIEITDIQGKVVQALVSAEIPKGNHTVEFNASGLPAGTYYCKYQNGFNTQTRSLLKVR